MNLLVIREKRRSIFVCKYSSDIVTVVDKSLAKVENALEIPSELLMTSDKLKSNIFIYSYFSIRFLGN